MSSMERRPWKVLLWREHLGRSSMKRRVSKNRLEIFMERRDSKGLLWRKDLPKLFCGTNDFNFFLRREELQLDFYGGNYFKKSSTERRPSKGLLKKEKGFVSF